MKKVFYIALAAVLCSCILYVSGADVNHGHGTAQEAARSSGFLLL